MKKQLFLRALLGFPLGVFISYTITLIISYLVGNGHFFPAVPAVIETMGSEVNAAFLQYFLSGILGAGTAASSLIWETENWSILKRTVVHLIVISALMFPVAYISRWMEHTLWGVVLYFLIFIVFYAAIWAVQYGIMSRKVQEINRKLQSK